MLTAIIIEIVAFLIFGALSQAFHDRAGQPLIRRDSFVDVIYFLTSIIVYSRITSFILAHTALPPTAALLASWPLWLKALVVLVLFDGMQYALHRWFHIGPLWRHHAIHHSPEEIDILTSFRIHPVNFLIYTGGPTIVLLLAGFPPAAFAALAPFNFLMGCLTHANLNWTYGPFRYVLASPMFHRWHHAVVEGSLSRNYAPNFPFWDLMFGTFYMPEGQAPLAYGVPEVPRGFIGQLAFPFAQKSVSA